MRPPGAPYGAPALHRHVDGTTHFTHITHTLLTHITHITPPRPPQMAYDLDLLQNKELFEKEIEQAVETLPKTLTFTTELNDLLTILLKMDPAARAQAPAIRGHPWFAGCLDTGASPLSARSPVVQVVSPSGDSKSRFPFAASDARRKSGTVGPPPGAAPVNMSALSDALKGLIGQKTDRSDTPSPGPGQSSSSSDMSRMPRPSMMRSDSMDCEAEETFSDTLRSAAGDRKGSLVGGPPGGGGGSTGLGLDLGHLSDALRQLHGTAEKGSESDTRGGRLGMGGMSPRRSRNSLAPSAADGDPPAFLSDRKGAAAGGGGGAGQQMDLMQLSSALQALAGSSGNNSDSNSSGGSDDGDQTSGGGTGGANRKGSVFGAAEPALDLSQLSAALQAVGGDGRKGSMFLTAPPGSGSQPLDANHLAEALKGLGDSHERSKGGNGGSGVDRRSRASSPTALPATLGGSDRSAGQRARSPAPARAMGAGSSHGSETDRGPAASHRSRSPAPVMPPLPPIDTSLPPLRSPAQSPATTGPRSRHPSLTADQLAGPAAELAGSVPAPLRSRPASPVGLVGGGGLPRRSIDSLPPVRSRSNSFTLPPIEATEFALRALAALQVPTRTHKRRCRSFAGTAQQSHGYPRVLLFLLLLLHLPPATCHLPPVIGHLCAAVFHRPAQKGHPCPHLAVARHKGGFDRLAALVPFNVHVCRDRGQRAV